MSNSPFLNGLYKKWFEAIFAARLIKRANKRFGLINSIRELRLYAGNDSSFFNSIPNRYLKHGKDIYVLPNLPPLNRVEFLDYLLDDVNALNHSCKSPLVFALVSISSRCPYYCQYCYSRRNLQQQEVVPISVLVRSIRCLRDSGVRNILLTGGEPMMRWRELPGLLDACCNSHTGFWLVSTGWEMDKPKLSNLRSKGLRGVMISLDSMDEDECVRFKGSPDAFPNAIRAIQDAGEAGLITCIDCVARGTLLERAKFDEFIKFAGKLGIHYINFFSLRPIREGGVRDFKPFTVDELKKLALLIRNAQQEQHYRNMPVPYSPDVWEALRGCTGGQVFIYISPEGDVTSCPFLDNISGNILKDDIAEIVDTIRNERLMMSCSVNEEFAKAFGH